jgi:hypothetical protein
MTLRQILCGVVWILWLAELQLWVMRVDPVHGPTMTVDDSQVSPWQEQQRFDTEHACSAALFSQDEDAHYRTKDLLLPDGQSAIAVVRRWFRCLPAGWHPDTVDARNWRDR